MPEEKKNNVVMDINQIKEVIPHRYPFLLVDRIVELDEENKRIVSIKNVTMNEPFFTGHYPDLPVMPGVLQVEAMAQTACIFLLLMPQNKGKVPFFTGIDEVKFRRQVVPGDQLRIICDIVRIKPRVAKCKVEVHVDGDLVCGANLTCMLAEAK